ncbi:hypothetical protein [Alteribacillus iranensis]|uniref:Uncharacterized protein n=1 Tax=Alteribacillus iranensis TaxID=930128 RepID=A0A1I2BRS3_9BACI|nr:hypothetical protein [Alteribacillus iranensis]SFE58851.1 hypothetical protein SAMN05192532_102472 [Alteribacillus iranensis]
MAALKSGLAWVTGVVITMILISLWQGEDVRWGQTIAMSTGGFLTFLVIGAIRKTNRDDKN